MKLNYFQCLKDLVPVIPNPSIATILYDKHRMKFDIETIEKTPFINEQKKLNSKYNTLAKMQSAFEDIMTCYAKRNSAFAYNQSQSQILRRILEVVPDAKKAFWIYT